MSHIAPIQDIRTLPRAKRLHHDNDRYPLALGCFSCPDFGACGGLRIAAATFSCLDRCCGLPDDCDSVCPGNANFAERVREVGGFNFTDVARTSERLFPPLPLVVPLIYSGGSRVGYRGPVVALPMSRIIRRTESVPRFADMEELAKEFRFSPSSTVVLSGTDDDRPLERWWNLGKSGRRAAARAIAMLGVHAATSLNFSMFTDRPRHDDLHSAKRIALVWQEMMDAGLPTALHVNARTDEDWLRWTDFVVARSEVDAICYEFATGAASPQRAIWHAARLVRLAQAVRRPLCLILRGGRSVLPLLLGAFDSVTVMDTTAYLKTINRQSAYIRADGTLDWCTVRTEPNQPLDELLDHNIHYINAEVTRAASDTSSCGVTKFHR